MLINLFRPTGMIVIAVMAVSSGCTVHPQGEQQERRDATKAGQPFQKQIDARSVPPLPDNPTPDDLVQHALLANAELEEKYWEWRSAIEQIPQDGTQTTNLALSASLNISRGSTGLGEMTAGAGNDPMADIVLPPKLSTAARRALENARAAGQRFRKAQFELRDKVLFAYYDYALNAELIRLEKSNLELLKTTAMVTEARNGAGSAAQQDLLKARNEVDLSNNDIVSMSSQLTTQRALLNALLNRLPDAPLPVPTGLPPKRKTDLNDEQLLAFAAWQNPEIAALSREIAGRKDGMMLAKLQYLPDISISANSDLKGIAQGLFAMVTVPWLRHEAIDAAVAQAEANVRAAEAMQRDARNNIAAAVILDIVTLRDADRQLDLFEHVILPRARQAVEVARTAYETGHSSLLELLDNQRSLISLDRLVATLKVTREKRLVDLESTTAQNPGRAK